MPNQVGTSQVIRFATFEVDLQAQELRKAGLQLKLSGQPFQVLAILLEQPGTVVTREELQKRVCWRACKSHPIIRNRPPSIRALRSEHRKSTRLVVRPTSL